MNRTSVLLADDHVMLMDGLVQLVRQEFDIVGLARDGRALVELARQKRPDVIVTDISMPLLNGIDAARRLPGAAPNAKIVFVTMHEDSDYIGEAFRAGGSGYVLKRSAGSELISAIQEVQSGRHYLTPLASPEALRPTQRRGREFHKLAASLTARQREVLQLVAEGRAVKEIAVILEVSAKTVEFHKAALMERLRIHTTAELTRYAIEHGMILVNAGIT